MRTDKEIILKYCGKLLHESCRELHKGVMRLKGSFERLRGRGREH